MAEAPGSSIRDQQGGELVLVCLWQGGEQPGSADLAGTVCASARDALSAAGREAITLDEEQAQETSGQMMWVEIGALSPTVLRARIKGPDGEPFGEEVQAATMDREMGEPTARSLGRGVAHQILSALSPNPGQ